MRTNCIRCQRCFWQPQRHDSEGLKRCWRCRLSVCFWCRRTDVDGCRLCCDGPTPPSVLRKRCREDDARWFPHGVDNRRAMSLRSEAAPSPDTSLVRLLAAGRQYLAGGRRDSGSSASGTVAPRYLAAGSPFENVERASSPENEPWDAFEDDPWVRDVWP